MCVHTICRTSTLASSWGRRPRATADSFWLLRGVSTRARSLSGIPSADTKRRDNQECWLIPIRTGWLRVDEIYRRHFAVEIRDAGMRLAIAITHFAARSRRICPARLARSRSFVPACRLGYPFTVAPTDSNRFLIYGSPLTIQACFWPESRAKSPLTHGPTRGRLLSNHFHSLNIGASQCSLLLLTA